MQVNQESLYSEILPNLFISGTLDEDVVQRGKSNYSLAQPALSCSRGFPGQVLGEEHRWARALAVDRVLTKLETPSRLDNPAEVPGNVLRLCL